MEEDYDALNKREVPEIFLKSQVFQALELLFLKSETENGSVA